MSDEATSLELNEFEPNTAMVEQGGDEDKSASDLSPVFDAEYFRTTLPAAGDTPSAESQESTRVVKCGASAGDRVATACTGSSVARATSSFVA